MAKFEGTQSIPAEYLDLWRAGLTDEHPGKIVRKRYPYRVRKMQKYGTGVTPAQQAQRDRFLAAIEKFNETSPAERARWYASMPPWGSLLWYFNWFLLSGISGVLGAIVRGIQVIRRIDNYGFGLGPGFATYTFTSAIDPAKSIILLHGVGANYITVIHDETTEYLAHACVPVCHSLLSSSAILRWSLDPQSAVDVFMEIIEYI